MHRACMLKNPPCVKHYLPSSSQLQGVVNGKVSVAKPDMYIYTTKNLFCEKEGFVARN